MDFFKILNAALNILAWLIVLAAVWALYPYFMRLLHAVQVMHDFAR